MADGNNNANKTLAEVEAKLKAIGIDVECNNRRPIEKKSSSSKDMTIEKDSNRRYV